MKETPTGTQSRQHINQVILVSMHIVLLILLFSSYSKTAIWDEDIFRNNCFLLNKMGFTKEFLRSMQVQAPGPLYQFFHFIFFPLTGYALFKMRLANFFIFIVTELVIYKTFKGLLKSHPAKERFFNLLMLLAFPGFFVTAIFCMSEAPTYFILALVVYLLVRQQLENYVFNNALVHHLLLGILMGLLIIGRTQFLVAPFIYIVAVFFTQTSFKKIIYPLLTVAVSLLLSAPMFIIWGGLVPPAVANLDAGVSQLNFRNMFIVMGYFVFIQYGLFRNRTLITTKEWIGAGIIAIGLFFANQFYFGYHYDSASLHMIPPAMMFTVVAVFTLLALYLAAKEGLLMLQSRNMLQLFSYAAALLVLLSMIKMSNYNVGVRHIGQAGLLLTVSNLCAGNKLFSTYRYQYLVVAIFIVLNFMVILNQLFSYPTLLH